MVIDPPDPQADASAPEMEVGVATSVSEWNDLAGRRFVPLRILANRSDPFAAKLRSRAISRVRINDITATPHRIERALELISPNDDRHYKLSLQLEGTGFVAQDGREAVLRKGDIAIYDTSRPYTIHFTDDVRCLVMAFPQDALEVVPRLVRGITAVRLAGDQGVGAAISPFMQYLADNLEFLDGATGERMVRSSLDLVTTLVYAQMASADPDLRAAHRVDVDSCKRWIDERLDDPDLNADVVARSHYISVRHLQHLFHEEGLTVSGYVRIHRLERCRLDLCEPALAEMSVFQIAQRWGFTDASHFSKAFKTEFGVAPRDFRALRLALDA